MIQEIIDGCGKNITSNFLGRILLLAFVVLVPIYSFLFYIAFTNHINAVNSVKTDALAIIRDIENEHKRVINEAHQIDRESNTSVINLTHSVSEQRNTMAGVTDEINYGWIKDVINSYKVVSPETIVTIIDNKGLILARYPNTKKMDGKLIDKVSEKMAAINNQEKDGLVEGADANGIVYILAFARLQSTQKGYVYALISIPKNIALSDSNSIYIWSILFITLGFLVSLLIILVIGQKIFKTGKTPSTNETDYLLKGEQYRQNKNCINKNELVIVSSCNRQITHAKDEKSLLENICSTLLEQGKYYHVIACRIEPDEHRTITPIAVARLNEGISEASKNTHGLISEEVKLGCSLTATAAQTLKAFVVKDIKSEQNFPKETNIAFAITIPLYRDGIALGALILLSDESRTCNAGEIEMLIEIARDVSNGIIVLREREKNYQLLEKLSYFDANTLLPNRVYFEKQLKRTITEEPTQNKRGALLLIDTVRSKEIIDAMGFQVGELIYRETCKRIRAIIPESMLLAKMHASSFAIFTDFNDLNSIKLITTQIIESFRWPILFQNISVSIKIVIGIALYPEHGANYLDLITNANIALKQAKSDAKTYDFYCDDDFTKR